MAVLDFNSELGDDGDYPAMLGNIELAYVPAVSAAASQAEQVYANVYWRGHQIYIHGTGQV